MQRKERCIFRNKASFPSAQVVLYKQIWIGHQALERMMNLGKICRKYRLEDFASHLMIRPGSRIRCHSGRLTLKATALEDIYLFESLCPFVITANFSKSFATTV